ncbi:uncharacterized protein MELLADRAFT_93204 [Melampsora larici-populina 98AG31]|uniref:Uncharacterized protein n=1 Tax=Melampsora larici-populina (strain 98AG31 / pathotype 3-4-7) TaxID=747676 RepID=F4S471_MELLP|nr:uncharacterized protein MELLADRAFT_93204 [Melampsora larici-populina 98AG31]EGG00557.1 hypothetical protein MELLADRAFT_93204 [Melampsora larici-populina 98AG31]
METLHFSWAKILGCKFHSIIIEFSIEEFINSRMGFFIWVRSASTYHPSAKKW